MKRVLMTSFAAAAILLASPSAQSNAAPADETRLTLREEFVRIINRDRIAHALRPLRLDAQASAVADQYCREQIRNGTTGHFTVDGLSPYMRYSFAGGDDGLTENAAAWSASYSFTDRELFEMVKKSERAMIEERAPHDGHRRAIFDPFATDVGIGLAWHGGEFRLTQEFIRRYVEWVTPPSRAAREGETVLLVGRPAPGGSLDAISVHFEPAPHPIPPRTANAIATYALPALRHDYLPRLRSYRERRSDGALYEVTEQYANGRRGEVPIAADGTFTFRVPFPDGPGVYTIVTWIRRAGLKEPIAASNVSILVERAGGSSYGGTTLGRMITDSRAATP